MLKNYYVIPGVDRHSSLGQIKHAYRRIAKQRHPNHRPGVPPEPPPAALAERG